MWSDAEDSDDEPPKAGSNNNQKSGYSVPPVKPDLVSDIKSFTPISPNEQEPLEPTEESEWTFSWDGWEKTIKSPKKEAPKSDETVEKNPATENENNDIGGEEESNDAFFNGSRIIHK